MVFKSIIGATGGCLAFVSFNAESTLISRLSGRAYYDDVLDISWLVDADAAGTTMTWDAADAWAAGVKNVIYK